MSHMREAGRELCRQFRPKKVISSIAGVDDLYAGNVQVASGVSQRHKRGHLAVKHFVLSHLERLVAFFSVKCSRSTDSADGLSEQTRWFVQARANLQVLLDSFAHAPSRDMSPELLRFLIRVMQLQAQESVFLRQMLECQNESKAKKLHLTGKER
ncbi:Rhophilin-2 [Taenia crassiceps]|uniref:Rhophilin-2 n=1 Tax=Taenia crassiceps TaxID=6207 RepID=A0ABR4QCC2_9CEST